MYSFLSSLLNSLIFLECYLMYRFRSYVCKSIPSIATVDNFPFGLAAFASYTAVATRWSYLEKGVCAVRLHIGVWRPRWLYSLCEL